jgi:hypothetical protein
MLYRDIIAVCSEIHAKHINTAVWAKCGIFKIVCKTTESDYYLCHVCLSVHWKSVYKICTFRQSVEKIQVSLKYDKISGFFK